MKKTDTEMGKISNLITDMTLLGADENELARAVRHSMVVIDAEKHKLDYKDSEKVNNIAALKVKYQGKKTGGASTIISRAKGQYEVYKRQGSPRINLKGRPDYDPSRPEGALLWKTADKLEYVKKIRNPETGKWEEQTKLNKKTGELEPVIGYRTQKSTKMAETDDAYTLVSKQRHPMELVYADYANSMKAMANRARVELSKAGKIAYDKNAKQIYKDEVDSLEKKLNKAEINAVRERAAQRMANVSTKKKIEAAEANGETLKKKDIKKASQQALTRAREEVGSSSRRERNIPITDKEWAAIQAGAISEAKLIRILNNSDPDILREKAMPKTTKELSSSKQSRIKAMSSTYTMQQIADKLGVSTSTVSKYLKGGK